MGFFKNLKDNYLDQREEFRSFRQPRKYVGLFAAIGIAGGAVAGLVVGTTAAVAFYSATHVYGLAALAGLGWVYDQFKEKDPNNHLKGVVVGPLIPLWLPAVVGAKIAGAAGRVLDALASVTYLEILRMAEEGRPVVPEALTQIAPSPPANTLPDNPIAPAFRQSSEMPSGEPLPKRELARGLGVDI